MTDARIYYVQSPTADVHETPDINALRGKFESQLVYGETFIAESDHGDWVKGTCGHDGYTGFVERKHLTHSFNTATHLVTDIRAHIYRDATIKSPLLRTLSFGSKVCIIEQDEKFAKLADGTYIYARHLSPIGTVEKDHVKTALRFLETPYQWGGRSGFGIDCSGLVQVSLAFAGVSVPRDTEQQVAAIIGHDVTTENTYRRGDIVYFQGHVGIMIDDKNMVHANATHMRTMCEPLSDVTARTNGITCVRRVF